MEKNYRYKAIKENGELLETFSTKENIDKYIEEQILKRGLDWRVGYLIRFKDGLQIEFLKKDNSRIKY